MDNRDFLYIRLCFYCITTGIAGLFIRYSDIGSALMSFAVLLAFWGTSAILREYNDTIIEERWKISKPGVLEVILIVLFIGWFAFISSLHLEHKRPEQLEQEFQDHCKQLYGPGAGTFTKREYGGGMYRYCYDSKGDIKVFH